MKALKKNEENLRKVVDTFCDLDTDSGLFVLDFITSSSAILCSKGRYGIGKSLISLIPCNWFWRITFEDGILKLFIWLES